MYRIIAAVFTAFLLLLSSAEILPAKDKSPLTGEIKNNIRAEGSCAIVSMSAEQSRLLALQRARASAIEQAAGILVSSSTLVKNYTVAVDFIKSYAKGFIVHEQVTWLPIEQYRKEPSSPPIPEYRVKIIADVYIPVKKTKPLGLRAKLNKNIFRSSEKATITISVNRESRCAIFNIMADDKVAILFPNRHETNNLLLPNQECIFPAKDSKLEVEMSTLPGHERDTEAFFVVAVETAHNTDFLELFTPTESVILSDFFSKLSEIADYSEDFILPYEVIEAKP